MKAVVHEQLGKPSAVVLCVDRPIPEPEGNKVRIRMRLSPIHNHDVLTIRGHYGKRPQLPAGSGIEALGEVDSVGSNVTHLQVGNRVVIGCAAGAWAEFFVAPARAVAPIRKSSRVSRPPHEVAFVRQNRVISCRSHRNAVSPNPWRRPG